MTGGPGGTLRLWAVMWHSHNRLDGKRDHLVWAPHKPGWPRLFRTRRECREYIEQTYGYIKHRPDLRREPHGWRMPTATRVVIGLDTEAAITAILTRHRSETP